MTVKADDFRNLAKQTYAALKPAFGAEERKFYWRLGHSFDTVIDYLATIDHAEVEHRWWVSGATSG